MNIPTIEETAAMSDQELSEFLGLPKQLKKFREGINELNALTGKARKEAEEIWANRLRPSLDAYSLDWIKEDAIRQAKPNGKGEAELADASPSSIL